VKDACDQHVRERKARGGWDVSVMWVVCDTRAERVKTQATHKHISNVQQLNHVACMTFLRRPFLLCHSAQLLPLTTLMLPAL
jgi:hypothetical protein